VIVIGRRLGAWLVVACCALAPTSGAAAPPPGRLVATPAPAAIATEIARAVEWARQRFEARDLAGILTSISEQYRSSGLTKGAVRDQLLAMFSLYQQLQARVTIDKVELVEGGAWVYTSGEIAGRLPLMGWVTVLAWKGQPEVARVEAGRWRLFGFQD
jgi:hypothetical protein